MRKTMLHVLGLSAFLLACGADGGTHEMHPARDKDAAADAPTRAGRDAGAQGPADAGQARGSDAATSTQCEVDRCEHQGEALARSLMAPSTDVTTVKGGDCTRVDIVGVVAGLACTCLTSNGWIYIGPDGAGCFARGRAGDCLWDDSEFKACTRGDPTCPAACEELGKRYAADAAKSFDVTVRDSTCREGSCRHVLRIANACYTDRSIDSGRHFDCNLSAAEIFDHEDAAL